jgi:precorrin-8X/cobalt-precorrin-8 methylmutase
MIFHPSAIAAAMKAVRSGADIIVDVNMIKAGINKAAGAAFGCKVICRLSSSAVRKKARELGTTRSRIAMRASVALMKGAIVVIGNAPTALFEAIDLVREKKARPALIVGVPVGFVGASESKAALAAVKEVPFITCRGRKGGAAVACAIVNALLLMGRR